MQPESSSSLKRQNPLIIAKVNFSTLTLGLLSLLLESAAESMTNSFKPRSLQVSTDLNRHIFLKPCLCFQ